MEECANLELNRFQVWNLSVCIQRHQIIWPLKSQNLMYGKKNMKNTTNLKSNWQVIYDTSIIVMYVNVICM